MNKTNVKIDGKETVEIRLNGGLFFKKGEDPGNWKLDEDGYLIGADGKYYERWYDDSEVIDNNPIVDLNGQWVEDTVSEAKGLNIDKNFDYFMSNSNYNVSNGYAQFKVSWKGLTHVDFLYRSYAEGSYDYLVINGLDKDKFTSEPSASTSGILAHTSGSQTTTYKTLSIDCDEGEHFIWFCYRKDSSVNSNDDRAFVGVPNNYKSGEIFEKQGKELFYDYIESSDYIVPRDGYIQYKYYKTYVSPNGHNTFRTSEYVLGEEIFVGYNTITLRYTDGSENRYTVEDGILKYSTLPNYLNITEIEDVNNKIFSLSGTTSSSYFMNLTSINLPMVSVIPYQYFSGANFRYLRLGEPNENNAVFIDNYAFNNPSVTSDVVKILLPTYTAIGTFAIPKNFYNIEFTDTYDTRIGLPEKVVLLNSYAMDSSYYNSLSSAHKIWSSIHSKYSTSTIFSHNMYGIASGILGAGYITQANLPECWFIAPSACKGYSKMTLFTAPKTLMVMNSAFQSCSNLKSINFGMCSYIGDYAFSMCSRMTSANIRATKHIGVYAFFRCSSLSSITNYWISYIGADAFYGCEAIKSINLNNAYHIGDSAFYGCYALSNVYMHKIPTNELTGGVFSMCNSLLSIHLDPSIYDYMVETYGSINVYLSGGKYRTYAQMFTSE